MTFELVTLREKATLETFLRPNPYLHIYALGDLDDFFWPHTTWYGLTRRGVLRQVVLVYHATNLPAMLALTADPPEEMARLLRSLAGQLPARFYAHLSPRLAPALRPGFKLAPHGAHLKLALRDPQRLADVDTSHVVPLSLEDLDDLTALYRESYPGNWFDARMLATGCYYGVRRRSRLVSVAGIHVVSPTYRVAALGNVTTHPDHRGRGFATSACAALCRTLLRSVDHIGANVKADNTSALACYARLGFTRVAEYAEWMVERRGA